MYRDVFLFVFFLLFSSPHQTHADYQTQYQYLQLLEVLHPHQVQSGGNHYIQPSLPGFPKAIGFHLIRRPGIGPGLPAVQNETGVYI